MAPELVQQLLEADPVGVEGDQHRLGMTGCTRAHLLVGRVVHRAPLVSGDGIDHSGHDPEELLHTPEATGGESRPVRAPRACRPERSAAPGSSSICLRPKIMVLSSSLRSRRSRSVPVVRRPDGTVTDGPRDAHGRRPLAVIGRPTGQAQGQVVDPPAGHPEGGGHLVDHAPGRSPPARPCPGPLPALRRSPSWSPPGRPADHQRPPHPATGSASAHRTASARGPARSPRAAW